MNASVVSKTATQKRRAAQQFCIRAIVSWRMDAKESAEHAAAAAAQYKEAQTPTSQTSTPASSKRDRTASLDDVDDAKPIANYRARGVCKAALGKSFLFGRRWTPGTYAVDIDRSHVVRFEDDAAGTCWEDTPTNRYAFAGDCDV